MMKTRNIIMAVVTLIICGMTSHAATISRDSILAEYNSNSPKFEKADAVLNKVRLATVNSKKALEYAEELEEVLFNFPDYPYRAEAYYFLGLNYKIAEKYDDAIDACFKAVRLNPTLRRKTPITAFIKTARFESRAKRYPRNAYLIIIATLTTGLIIMLMLKPIHKPTKKYLITSLIIMISWCCIYPLLALIDTSSHVTRTADYPQPALINTTIGTIGDAPLIGIFVYGLLALTSVIFFVFMTSNIKSKYIKSLTNICGSLLLSCGIMTLCYMKYCYRNATFINDNSLVTSRMNILVKDLVWQSEIPDEMLELYDEGFRKKVLESRKTKIDNQ